MSDWGVFAVPKTLTKGPMGCNNLVLNDHSIVVPSDEPMNEIVDALSAQNFEVIRIPYRVPCIAGGSFRCAHQLLTRR